MMDDNEILKEVKTRLGITGEYQDKTLMGYINDTKEYLTDAGVSAETVSSSAAIGVISRGVSDLWNYGAGTAEFSSYFYQRAAQLSYGTSGSTSVSGVVIVPLTEEEIIKEWDE